MADVVITSFGTISDYNAAIGKPAGSGAGLMVIGITWFNALGTVSISGWDLQAQATDARTSETTSSGVFTRVTADISAEAASFTVTQGGGADGARGRCYFLQNQDGSVPVLGTSTVGSEPPATVTPPNVNVTRAGSLSMLVCGSWFFNAWTLSGFGGTQTTPAGFSGFEPAGTTEYGDFYKTGLSPGNVPASSFGGFVERFAVVQLVVQPASDAPPPQNIMVPDTAEGTAFVGFDM